MPLAVTLRVVQHGGAKDAVLLATSVTIAIVLVVAVYSLLRVRTGSWSHVDASAPNERLHLNTFLGCLLLAVSILQWAMAQPPALVLGLALSAAIVFAALATRRRLKVSLHCAFGSYAASLLWPDLPAVAVLLSLVLAVAWSRIKLRRHTATEVAAGLALGMIAGLVLNAAAPLATTL